MSDSIVLKLTSKADNNGSKYSIFAKWWGPFKTKAVSTTEGNNWFPQSPTIVRITRNDA